MGWETYERLVEEAPDCSAARFSYDRGMLEIVSPSCSGIGKVRVEPEEEEKTR